MLGAWIGALGGLVLSLSLFGQEKELPAFDVASVKQNTAPPDYVETGTAEHGKVTFHNANIRDCIRYAYGLASNEQVSGPEWTADRTVRFDIVAIAPADTPQDALRQMLQRLLAERFHLAVHRELKPVAHLEMGVAKGGVKLPRSPEEPAAPKSIFGRGRLDYTHAPMHEVAMLLSMQLNQPVLNRTAFEGFYDLKLEWRPDGEQSRREDEPRPDLFEALARIGLTLTETRSPIDVVAIDRVDRTPDGN